MSEQIMRVLVAPDKLKGSLGAAEAAEAIARGFARGWPSALVTSMPVADGGEGTAAILCAAGNGEWISLAVRGPLGRQVAARYAWLGNERTAVIEMSEAAGLHLTAPEDRNPLRASTFGVGELIGDAAARGAVRIIVTLGGSATNDGGAGMAAALDYAFLSEGGERLDPCPESLLRLAHIRAPGAFKTPGIVAACDVSNPLLGENGATRVFGPQKGATPGMLPILEQALESLARISERDLGCAYQETAGAGAAGGLGFGLFTFCGAKFRSGFELVAEAIQLEKAIAASDLVITGEGRLDAQTVNGKAPAGVAAIAKRYGKPVIAMAGAVSNDPRLDTIFDATFPIVNEPMSLEEAISGAANLVECAAERAARILRAGAAFKS